MCDTLYTRILGDCEDGWEHSNYVGRQRNRYIFSLLLVGFACHDISGLQ
jgi:hypothetical protein